MRWLENGTGRALRGASYFAHIRDGEAGPRVRLWFDGRDFAEFPLISALDGENRKETLEDARVVSVEERDGASVVTLAARSNLWEDRRFVWRFEKDRILYRQYARGEGALGRCYFLSSGRPIAYDAGDSRGYPSNASFHVPKYRSFNPNLANITLFDISQPGFVGIGRSENIGRAEYFNIERHTGVFSPAPLLFAFTDGTAHMGVGIGAKPGEYCFNGLEYSGCMKEASSFHVQYMGYTSVSGEFASPEMCVNFGYGAFECLKDYVRFIDENGYGTDFRFPEAAWHREPIFCGWAEQTAMCAQGQSAGERATQANYEKWIAECERRGIPFGTVVIDDKWQKRYGTFEPDEGKWPDLAGFVRKQHEKGRHVLLWIPGYQAEGLPADLCARGEDGKPLFALPGNPKYDSFLFESIVRLVKETDIDGFKEDWIGRTADKPGYAGYGALHGLEFLRRFQFVVHEALHSVKPDGLLETQTPNPLFRESSDMLRLNDIWYAAREVPDMMRDRARVARVAGWNLLDCDNASACTIGEWFQYAQAQPDIGVPALYFLTRTESSRESMTDAQAAYLAALWREYREKNALPNRG